MAKRKKDDDAVDDAGAEDAPGTPDLGLVMSVSLLTAALANAASLQGVMDGKTDPVVAATWFVIAWIVALIGFGSVALLYHRFSTPAPEQFVISAPWVPGGAAMALSEDDPFAGLGQDREITDALKATDELIHDDRPLS